MVMLGDAQEREELYGALGKKNPESSTIVKNCENYATIHGCGQVGGIVGCIPTYDDSGSAEVCQCINNGEIISRIYYGGIVGMAAQVNITIQRCINNGNATKAPVSSDYSYGGGIVGTAGRGTKILNCYNTGNVDGLSIVGGIAGNVYNTPDAIMTNCYNIGNVTGNTNIGGLLGSENTTCIITNSYYLEGTASKNIGNKTDTESFAKNKEFLQTTFVSNATSGIWKVENDDFPKLTFEN